MNLKKRNNNDDGQSKIIQTLQIDFIFRFLNCLGHSTYKFVLSTSIQILMSYI